jgi:hypothetical protein
MASIVYRAGGVGVDDDVVLTNLTLYKDKKNYCLSAKFKVEDGHSIRELDIPKIRLNVNPKHVAIRSRELYYTGDRENVIDLGFGELPLEKVDIDSESVYYTEKILEEKYTEMTLDEIEKKLGYKVKIVNK